jgi:hypothetical protein
MTIPNRVEDLYCNLCKKAVTGHDHCHECSSLNGLYAVRHNAVQNEVTMVIKKDLRPMASNCASKERAVEVEEGVHV